MSENVWTVCPILKWKCLVFSNFFRIRVNAMADRASSNWRKEISYKKKNRPRAIYVNSILKAKFVEKKKQTPF